MSIFIWNSEIKNAYIWTTPVKEIYVGTTKVRPSGWLPSAYQEVEYIQSSWTQYIRVWTQFKTSYKVVVDLQMDVIWWDYIPVWIRWNAGSAFRYWIDAWNWYFTLISWWSNWTNTIREDKNRHTITIDKSIATIDWNNYNISYTDYTFPAWLWVFCYASITDVTLNHSSNKLYKLDIYDENWTHIYDLVPCYRKSDNVIGMYDLVNDQFYTNNWTWTFTKWPDV